MVTPQDKVQLIARVAQVVERNTIGEIQHQLCMAEYDGWQRGWSDSQRLAEWARGRMEPLIFASGWTFGSLLMYALMR